MGMCKWGERWQRWAELSGLGFTKGHFAGLGPGLQDPQCLSLCVGLGWSVAGVDQVGLPRWARLWAPE
jgi:hypothetical protein